MERKRKLFVAKAALILGVIPVLIWAHEYGPDAGYCGVPKELGTCLNAQCHVGTLNGSGGGVSVAFPNGTNYVPGVKQHLVVTISDSAATQQAWGFQLTARTSGNTAAMAGSFASTDANTTLMCAGANLFTEQEVDFGTGSPQTCPANMPLAYMEHSLAGYQANLRKTGSATYEFDWTPPSTNVGDVVFYVAANAGPLALTQTNAHVYTATFTLTPATSSGTAPAISANGVVNGASFQPGIVPGSWITIQGSHLSPVTDTWAQAIVNGNLPAKLDGVSVSVGGKPAYIYYISDQQINALAPDAGTGTMAVTVTTPSGTSAAISANAQTAAPAFFLWAGQYAVATRQDFSFAVKNGTFAGVTTVPAKPGDVLILWGTGFGPTNPAAPIGVQIPSDKLYSTAGDVTVTIGNLPATVYGAALAPGFAGLYQVAIQVPPNAPDGDLPIVATINGAASPGNVTLTVQH
jgi:uncharacterized protein (TIGR03437 family)